MNIEKDSGPVLVFCGMGPDEPPPPISGDESWIDHLRVREQAERGAAKNATSPQARRVHQELAQAYSRIVERAARRAVRKGSTKRESGDESES